MAKKRLIVKIKDILVSPRATLCIGVVLVLTGAFELMETTLEKMLHFEIKSGHGLLIFGFSQVFTSVTHILEGIEDLGVATEEQALMAEEQQLKDEVQR